MVARLGSEASPAGDGRFQAGIALALGDASAASGASTEVCS